MNRRTLHVDMDEILDAMTSSEQAPFTFYLDLKTGKVESGAGEESLALFGEEDELASRLEDDPERYEEIPRYSGREEYDLMSRFADSVEEEDIAAMLTVALRGKGAFGRFRDVVFRYPDLKARWYAMQRQAWLDEALGWLEALEIEPVYELRPLPTETATPPQLSTPRVSLLDMLLLGAPDGKTELLDGRVLRQLNTRSPSEARGIFKHLARELCEFHGIAWRKRFIENTSRYDVERTHLVVDDTMVLLWVDVPLATWSAFGG
jgi:hypothetical protein